MHDCASLCVSVHTYNSCGGDPPIPMNLWMIGQFGCNPMMSPCFIILSGLLFLTKGFEVSTRVSPELSLSLSPSLYLSHSQSLSYTRSQDVPTTYDGQGMLLIWTVMVPDFWLKRSVAVPLVCSRKLHVLEINLSFENNSVCRCAIRLCL